MPFYIADSAMRGNRKLEAVVLLLQGSLPSTSVAPMEILGTAGVLWQQFHGATGEQLFHVRSASIGRRPTHHMIPVTIKPECAIDDIRSADLIVVPTAGADLDEICRAN